MWATWLMPSIKSQSKDRGVLWICWPFQGREREEGERFHPQHLVPLLNVSCR